jgi:hypothetical protein
MVRLLCAISILAVVGCHAPKEPVQVRAAEIISPDDANLVHEMSGDRKATRDRYVGKVIEIEIRGVDVTKATGSKVECDLRTRSSSNAVSYEAIFDLNDKLNEELKDELKGHKSADFSNVVRGVVRAIDVIDERSNLFVVKLDPAWLPPPPPRSFMTIVKDNLLTVLSYCIQIFLGVICLRIAWSQDWGWFWGIVLAAIIVGLTFLFWPWGMLGAAAIVGKLYQSYG